MLHIAVFIRITSLFTTVVEEDTALSTAVNWLIASLIAGRTE